VGEPAGEQGARVVAAGPTGVLDTIVVPLDGSATADRALPLARSLAQRTGAQVLLFTSTADGEGASRDHLDTAAAGMSGVDVSSVVVDGRTAAAAAAELAPSDRGRVLCMSTHGRGGLGRSVLGSVAEEILRAGSVSALLVGPSCDPAAFDRGGPVQLCIDGSDRSPAVVEAGGRWADLLDRDARLVIVANPFDARTGPESDAMFAELRRPLAERGLRAEGTCSYSSSIPVGIVIEAEQSHAPLMVMAPAARSTWSRRLLGSTTLSVLGDAPCPVLAVPERADGPARGPEAVS
jgi:nucleotide-binding universal stress UspA family protein